MSESPWSCCHSTSSAAGIDACHATPACREHRPVVERADRRQVSGPERDRRRSSNVAASKMRSEPSVAPSSNSSPATSESWRARGGPDAAGQGSNARLVASGPGTIDAGGRAPSTPVAVSTTSSRASSPIASASRLRLAVNTADQDGAVDGDRRKRAAIRRRVEHADRRRAVAGGPLAHAWAS